MFNLPKAIKGFTYVQSTDPINRYNVVDSDTWFNSSDNSMLIRHNGKWLSFIISGNYGYFAAGNTIEFGYELVIDRITFPFNTGLSLNVGNVIINRTRGCGCNSSNYGYIVGGGGLDIIKTVERIKFPFNSGISNNAGYLNYSFPDCGSFNSSNYGFCVGGTFSCSKIERITFPFDSGTANILGTMVIINEELVSGFNSSSHGYSRYGNYIQRITFPFDSGNSSIVGNLYKEKASCNTCNSSTSGYVIGRDTQYPDYLDPPLIEKVLFPFNSGIATLGGNITTSNSANNCALNSSNFGFNINAGNSSVERMSFPFDSGTAIITGNLTRETELAANIDETDFNMIFI